jgi:prohibitin 1
MLFLLSVLVSIGTFLAWQSARKSASSNALARGSSAIFGAVALLFAALAFVQAFTIVPAGHVGIVDFFGTVSEKTLSPGINFVNPMAKVVTYSAQTKEHKETMQVLSREGLTIGLELSVLYRLNPDSAASVYKTIFGGDYEDVILVPQFRSISRAVTASFQASALYPVEECRTAFTVDGSY